MGREERRLFLYVFLWKYAACLGWCLAWGRWVLLLPIRQNYGSITRRRPFENGSSQRSLRLIFRRLSGYKRAPNVLKPFLYYNVSNKKMYLLEVKLFYLRLFLFKIIASQLSWFFFFHQANFSTQQRPKIFCRELGILGREGEQLSLLHCRYHRNSIRRN